MKMMMGLQRNSLVRWFALLSIVGLACFLALVVVLHGLRPDDDPLSHTVSEYALGAYGVLMTLGFVVLGLGSVALVLALAVCHAGKRPAGLVLLVCWSLGVLVLSVYHTDKSGIPVSPGGFIHSFVALIALLSLVFSALFYTLYFRRHAQWQAFARPSLLLTLIMFVTLIVFLASPLAYKGITERVLLGVDSVWLIGLARHLFSISTRGLPAGGTKR
ncbi:hypothetical protein KDA_50040 [Dictyobacter alpinus]|uniref:DUF998 domain-containing protein n=1 Tax=Dictyobacter alpinus TaxID=2014873 RepID=A0A402BDZ6_9CHLR|nr:DUF998 domain-containing protein [Dictyobacter alpinus]GCE29520.1 hypothetical protein KDA_50040 [Dictyobacter alpinus]